ncbi:hypothetical protein [Methylobacterium dankookense]|uniref:Uncharacterized protein n=1 Tax=Methylobacterium dankookense TaxID=560405 RepID=A0A564G2G8_9HYPH|nr:hypothetical protein [Methylobacterium dankookense]GJD55194.1 hypothetical protein IFDJLNFL_1077 [Methylobacterium dankookense]VUF14148.1 hypothetical protein MTDSW087_03863 [Methylobacterium dankookense]
MRTIQLLALAALTSAATLGTAVADDRLHLTPPLYREHARTTAAVRPASELTTTPSLTSRAPAAQRIVAEAVSTR